MNDKNQPGKDDDKQSGMNPALNSNLPPSLPNPPDDVIYPPGWPAGHVMFWYQNTDLERQMLGFDSLSQPTFYQPRWPTQEGYSEQKPLATWGDNTAALYHNLPFTPAELYPPSDPFPSTPSTSSSLDYKCLPPPHPYYHNALLPINNYAQQPDYSQVFSNWKMPSMKQMDNRNANPPHRTGPGTNNVRVRTSDKYRMVYTEMQRLELEKEYLTQPFVTSERKAALAEMLTLTERQIKIWFQNRRAKDRREKKK